jgi:hypothetical protein
MGEDRETTPDAQVRELFGEAEKRTAQAMEELVHRDSFGELLARVTENVMGLTKIGFDVLDLTVRNLRIAGRADLIGLGRQLARTEDKLERVLQEVETLQDQVAASEERRRSQPSGGSGGNAPSRSSGSSASPRRRSSARSSNGSSRSHTRSKSGKG